MAFFDAGGQAEAGGEFGITVIEPVVGSLGFHQIGNLVGQLRGQYGAAVRLEKHRQRHTPCPLARDAPIRAALHRAVDPVAAPGRQPFDGFDLRQRLAAQGFQRDEELLDGAEDDRRLRAPAMRIGMADRLLA